MKLVFLIGSTRDIGGGDYAQFVFAKELAKLGHEVVIFAGDRNFYSCELTGVKVFYRHTIPVFIKKIGIGKLNKLWDAVYTKTIIEPYLKQFKPDWIIGYLRDSAIKAQELGEKLNIKIANFVFENPKWMEEDLGSVWKQEWKNEQFRNSWLQTKTAYEKSTVLIPNSKLSGKKMKEWVPKAKISVPVYPGVEVPELRRLKRKIDVIYVGRLNPLKNVSDLIKAANPEWKIVIVGKGEDERKLKILAEEHEVNANFRGTVTETKKWALLRSSKVLVFPTSHEGFGMPPLEALACGCNVVCSDIPIFHEVYGDEVSYFPLHDVDELRRKIEIALHKEPVQTKLHKKYTWEKAVKTIEKILGE